MTGQDRTADSSNTATLPATRLRQWELLELAGEGTWARVYRARPVGARGASQGAYAVKLLQPQWEDDPRAIALLRREALAARSVAHPHLIAVLAASVRQPPYFLVMPWLHGRTLKARLRVEPPLAVHTVLRIGRQVTAALGALAQAGWSHGDVKPGNIFLSPEGHATLLDLGFARRSGDEMSAIDHCVLGTCAYLAPELISSTLGGDWLSDIYGLGVVLYEAFAGRLPFPTSDLAELATQHRTASPPRLERIAPHVPVEVAHLVHRMLAKDRLRRPSSPEDLLHRLTGLEIDSLAAWLR